jgi:hypothetical protein
MNSFAVVGQAQGLEVLPISPENIPDGKLYAVFRVEEDAKRYRDALLKRLGNRVRQAVKNRRTPSDSRRRPLIDPTRF